MDRAPEKKALPNPVGHASLPVAEPKKTNSTQLSDGWPSTAGGCVRTRDAVSSNPLVLPNSYHVSKITRIRKTPKYAALRITRYSVLSPVVNVETKIMAASPTL